MEDTRLVFMGTPVFACEILQELIDNKYNLVGVVSQPDKKVGRRQELTMTPVKKLALENNIRVIQPINIKEDYKEIIDLKPDLIITCAYGQIVPEVLLKYPKLSCINIHASLLPKYRGGAPIHKAVLNGDKESGITIMEMVKKMDAGQMFAKVKVDIDDDDTTAILHDKLAKAARGLLKDFLPTYILDNNIKGEIQDEGKVTYAYNISKEEEFISFKEDVRQVYNHIRGLISWPVGYGVVLNKRIKIHEAKMILCNHSHEYGKIIGFDDGMQVACKGGLIKIYTLQEEGKARMSYKEFYNGKGKIYLNQIFD